MGTGAKKKENELEKVLREIDEEYEKRNAPVRISTPKQKIDEPVIAINSTSQDFDKKLDEIFGKPAPILSKDEKASVMDTIQEKEAEEILENSGITAEKIKKPKGDWFGDLEKDLDKMDKEAGLKERRIFPPKKRSEPRRI